MNPSASRPARDTHRSFKATAFGAKTVKNLHTENARLRAELKRVKAQLNDAHESYMPRLQFLEHLAERDAAKLDSFAQKPNSTDSIREKLVNLYTRASEGERPTVQDWEQFNQAMETLRSIGVERTGADTQE